MPLSLTLPPLTATDALVLGSGPSFSEFPREALQKCGAVLYGAGHVTTAICVDHYALTDFDDHGAHIPAECQTTIHASQKAHQSAVDAKYPQLDRLQVVDPSLIYHGASGMLALVLAVAHGRERVFVLGFDGCFGRYWQLLRRFHDPSLDPEEEFRLYWHPTSYEQALESDELHRQAGAELMKQHTGLFNLSPHSVMPFPLAPEIAVELHFQDGI